MARVTRTYTQEELWRFFAEYCRWERAAGGPDPHMSTPAEMSRTQPLAERVWRGGCYVAVYNAPYAEVLWRGLPLEHARSVGAEGIRAWLDANWHRISVHVARRTARRPDWMTQYLVGYLSFVDALPELLSETEGYGDEQRYDLVWDLANSVPRLGRYVAIKLLEYLRRVDVPVPPLHDLRARDGFSPRGMLAKLWPERPDLAIKKNDQHLLSLAEDYASRTQARLRDEYDQNLSMFEVQVLLCQFKQAHQGKQHPGRSGDSQLGLMRRAEREWPEEPTDFWRARRTIFPHETLGELQGWHGRRKELEGVLPTYGYTWSDLLYDYGATTDLAHPVWRPAYAELATAERAP